MTPPTGPTRPCPTRRLSSLCKPLRNSLRNPLRNPLCDSLCDSGRGARRTARPAVRRVLAQVVAVVVVAVAVAVAVPSLTTGAAAWSAPAGTEAALGAAVSEDWRPPTAGEVVRPADLPAQPWAPGHRGIDLAASAGSAVVAPAPGTVTFAGQVAGRPVVVISHGALRSSLEPVEATVDVGTVVGAGDRVGTVVESPASHCSPGSCLHWGVRRGEVYLDPATLLGRAEPIVLLPAG
ncbi:M23 family metallopeptidase [Isoptericola jiangsuensis]|uniref:M23 family metallopeptidase n=1 Tax=Isoptericola jiangsuensis TaxID=548579 RepID=UPI003AB0C11D